MRRTLISGAVIAGIATIILTIPLPYHVYCEFTVRSRGSENLYVQTQGEILRVSASPLQQVRKGQEILVLQNHELQDRMDAINGKLRETDARQNALQERLLRGDNSVMADIALGESEIVMLGELKKSVADKVRQLRLVAPRDGTLLPVSEQLNPQNGQSEINGPLAVFESKNRNAWLPMGMPVCAIGDPHQLEAVMSVPEERVAFVRQDLKVRLKPFAFASETLVASINSVGRQAIAPPTPDQPQSGMGAMAAAAMATPSNKYFATADLGNAAGLGLKVGSKGKAKIRCGYRSLAGRFSRWAADTFRFQ